MRPVTISQTGVGQSVVVPLDVRLDPFSVFLDALLSGGTATYNIEYTNDDVWSGVAPTNWTPVASMSALSASGVGSLAAPVRGVRINVTAAAGGTVTLRIVQAGH